MKIFILEDEIGFYPRNQIKDVLRKHDLTIAASVPEAIKLYKGGYDLLLLDHDMGGYFEDPEAAHGNTGTAFCKWLVGLDLPKPKQVILHSQNPQGRKSMLWLLREHGFKNIEECAFGVKYVNLLKEQLA